MKNLITITVITMLFACFGKHRLTERILLLKDSCSSLDNQLSAIEKDSKRKFVEIFHSTDTSGQEQIIRDLELMNDTANYNKYIKYEAQNIAKTDSIKIIKKQLLRQIDSLQLELRE